MASLVSISGETQILLTMELSGDCEVFLTEEGLPDIQDGGSAQWERPLCPFLGLVPFPLGDFLLPSFPCPPSLPFPSPHIFHHTPVQSYVLIFFLLL